MDRAAESVSALAVKTTDTEWLIVGAGLHGAHLAVALRERGVASSDMLLLDPQPLFGQWRARTGRLEMSHLRSPSVHHIAYEPMDLESYAGKKRRVHRSFRAPYARPRLSLFDAHCDHVARDYALYDSYLQGRADRCEARDSHVEVRCDDGRVLRTKRLVFALGVSELEWPKAEEGLDGAEHVFSSEEPRWPKSESHVTVVGGGITGAQLTLALLERGHTVTLATRRPLQTAYFDSDPCWIGPACMERFNRVTCPAQRRRIIKDARNRGTMPEEVKRRLSRARQAGELELVRIDAPNRSTRAEATFLATGFSARRPGGKLIDALVAEHHLPVAPCGYPLVDHHLRWHPRIHVMGALAELEIGPVARNIIGARRAAARITGARRRET